MPIRKVETSEAPVLSQLCLRIYPQFFTYLWDDEGKWYQETRYNAIKLEAEIADENSDYFFYCIDNEPVGYLKINYSKPLDDEVDCLEVERIYFLKEVAGKGLGKELMNFAFDTAKRLQKKTVFLKLMDSSLNSKAFYEKMGFQLCGTDHLNFEKMYPQYRGMLIMKKNL